MIWLQTILIIMYQIIERQICEYVRKKKTVKIEQIRKRVIKISWVDVKGNENSNEEKLNFFKIESGQSAVIRIVDEEPLSRWTHWINSAGRSVVCIGEKNGCPCCLANKEAKEAGLKTKPFSNSKKHTIHIINKSTNKLELLEQGNDFFVTLLGYREAMGDLRNFDLKITRTGVKKNTKYTIIPMPACSLTEEEQKMLEDRINLKEDLKAPTVEQVLELINGKQAESKDDEDIEIQINRVTLQIDAGHSPCYFTYRKGGQ